METNILVYPWKIERFRGREVRMYEAYGFKCFLNKVIEHHPHASVYLYTMIDPNGDITEDMDIADINKEIFGCFDYPLWEQLLEQEI